MHDVARGRDDTCEAHKGLDGPHPSYDSRCLRNATQSEPIGDLDAWSVQLFPVAWLSGDSATSHNTVS